MGKKFDVLKAYPAPWHLEGPYDLDGIRWGSDIAIVAANDECVLTKWSKDGEWPETAEYLVRLTNEKAGFPDAPLRLPERKLEEKRKQYRKVTQKAD